MRNKSLGSTAINEAIKDQQATREDQIIAATKEIYQNVEPSNDNSQLNKYLYPPYTNDKKGMA
tara:strand:+ start:961 stop:1149 length:189 start_codon:yes stop_codon:yes gene_type:complete